MPKPIKITQSLSEQLVEEFIEALKKYKLSDGKLTYSRQMTYDKKDVGNVNVCFTTQAFAKMVTLLHGFSTEVGWHGVVDRVEPDKFVISDILVYPQIVTGVTVDQDQEASQKWYMEYMKTQDEDGIFPRIRMQGHSHVNMGVTPSSTDEGFYADILKMVPDNDYYIFMIFNKRLEHFVKVYDMSTNTLYENDDVTVSVIEDGLDTAEFLASAKEMVTTKTYTAPSNYKVSESKSKPANSTVGSPAGAASNVTPIKQTPGYYGAGVGGYGSGYYNGYGGGYGNAYGGYDDYAPGATDYDAEIFGAPKRETTKKSSGKKKNWWPK